MILAIRPTYQSAIRIKNAIKEISKKDIPVGLSYRGDVPVLIRYGNTDGYPKSETQYNTKDFIKICANKYNFSNLMRERNIPAPVFNSNPNNLTFPLMIREKLSSTGARGIHVVKNEQEFRNIWRDGFYWTPFLNLKFELRVHVLGGQIKRVFKKQWDSQEKESEFPIRNLKNGYSYHLKDLSHYPKLDKLVESLTEVFGTDAFYGADIGWDDTNKRYFVIELNSAPNLNEISAQLYAQYFIERLGL